MNIINMKCPGRVDV